MRSAKRPPQPPQRTNKDRPRQNQSANYYRTFKTNREMKSRENRIRDDVKTGRREDSTGSRAKRQPRKPEEEDREMGVTQKRQYKNIARKIE